MVYLTFSTKRLHSRCMFQFFLKNGDFVLLPKSHLPFNVKSNTAPSSFPRSSNYPEEKYNFNLRAAAHEKPAKISDDIASATETFLYFFGPARSGTTFVSDAINSHPHAVIAHELMLFRKLTDINGSPLTKRNIIDMVWR